MLHKYFIIALRNVKRHKVISLINILGLAVCMSVGLMIIVFVKTSFSVDNFHQKAQRIYRVITKTNFSSGANLIAFSPSVLVNYLHAYPIIEDAVNIITFHRETVLARNIEIPVSTTFTENSFFRIFDYEILSGDDKTFLTAPLTAVLTKKSATKIFGNENPIGKVLTVKNFGDFIITGLVSNLSERSNLEDEVFISRSSLYSLRLNGKTQIELDSWELNYSSDNYVLLKQNSSQKDLDNLLGSISTNVKQLTDKAVSHVNYEFMSLQLNEIQPSNLISISGIKTSGQSPTTIGIFILITLVFIALSVFNYTNLTMARTFARAKEIGIRKTIGAVRSSIIKQIIIESVVFAFLGLILAFFLLNLASLNSYVSKNLDLTFLDIQLLSYSVLFALFTGIIAGIIPAITLSQINPVMALGNLLNTKLFKSIKARNLIIVTQFIICIIFISVLHTLYKQSNFQNNSDLGFNKKGILTFSAPVNAQQFQAELEKYSYITTTSLSSGRPIFEFGQISDDSENSIPNLSYYYVDQNFIEEWGISLVAGSNFPKTINSSKQYVILNQKCISYLEANSSDQVIGQFIKIDTLQAQVIGIVKDFHFRNFQFEIGPLALLYQPSNFKFISLKYEKEQYENVIDYIEKLWKRFEPNFPVNIVSYEDEFIKTQSHSDDEALITVLSLIAIATSCMGLFGLVLHNIEHRIKEIAIRKIMGSTILEIIIVVSKDFFKILLISLIIGLPVSYVLSNQLLANFSYRVPLNLELGFFTISIIFAIGLATICTQAFKASIADPVKALKNNE